MSGEEFCNRLEKMTNLTTSELAAIKSNFQNLREICIQCKPEFNRISSMFWEIIMLEYEEFCSSNP